MKVCGLCGLKDSLISGFLGVCLSCIREKPEEALSWARTSHEKARKRYGLPASPPKTPGGVRCNLCDNACLMGEGEKGYCGLRENKGGKLVSKVSSRFSLLHAYLDPIPTNCCASWFCPASKEGRGRYNLAVFFYGCGFDCLFCQNYSHKHLDRAPGMSLDELVKVTLRDSVYCVCFFGGSPESQLPFVIKYSREVLKRRKVRICFEWNGIGREGLVRKCAEIALQSGGIIKFDLKAFDEALNKALCGISNRKTLENFKMISEEYLPRASYPLLTATTLMVPGYVDFLEVEKIASFVAGCNPEIPYSLLVFYPTFYMGDLPITPRGWAFQCLDTARKYVRNVNLGNEHLLGFWK